MKSILIVDTQKITLSALKQIVKSLLPGYNIFEAGSEAEACEILKKEMMQICIADIAVAVSDPVWFIRKVKEIQPELQILVLTSYSENIYALNMIRAGAMGFVSKDMPVDEIATALKCVISNKRYISEAMLDRLVENPSNQSAANPFAKLNSRELEVARHLSLGKTISQISAITKLQVSTISTYKSKIFQKLNITNPIELYVLIKAHNILGEGLHDDTPA